MIVSWTAWTLYSYTARNTNLCSNTVVDRHGVVENYARVFGGKPCHTGMCTNWMQDIEGWVWASCTCFEDDRGCWVSARSQEIHGTVFLDPVWPRSYGLGMRLGLAGTTDCPDSITSQHFLSDLICCSSLLSCVHLVPPRPRSLSTCSFCYQYESKCSAR